MGIIYKVTCIITGKVYVGQSTRSLQERWQRHVSSAKRPSVKVHFHLAIRKYGAENFIAEILERPIKEDLDIRERFWIQQLGSDDPRKGYNLTTGGVANHGGWHQTTEVRALIGERLRGKPKSESHRLRLREAALLAKTLPTKELRQKIGAGVRASKVHIKQFKITSPTGEEYLTTEGLREFCRQHSLVYGTLWGALQKTGATQTGWKIERI